MCSKMSCLDFISLMWACHSGDSTCSLICRTCWYANCASSKFVLHSKAPWREGAHFSAMLAALWKHSYTISEDSVAAASSQDARRQLPRAYIATDVGGACTGSRTPALTLANTCWATNTAASCRPFAHKSFASCSDISKSLEVWSWFWDPTPLVPTSCAPVALCMFLRAWRAEDASCSSPARRESFTHLNRCSSREAVSPRS